jgi:hypothetical protein
MISTPSREGGSARALPVPAGRRVHRYFLDRSFTGGSVRDLPFPRWDRSLPAELRYPYEVLEHALPKVHSEGLHFHFTKNAYSLPEYGPHVVAVLLQEERCKVPVYGRHVLATLRNLETTPALCCRLHRRIGRLEAVLLFEYARDWHTHWKSLRAAAARSRRETPLRSEPVIISLPLGYHSQEEVPQRAMSERSLDLFFSGEIRHALPRWDYRRITSTSKFIARQQLWAELERLASRGRWRLDLGAVGSRDAATPTFASYSDKMMHTRLCVAPRGSVAETYRAYEGLRAGCLVVTTRVPPRSLLASAPLIQVDHWRELEGILAQHAERLDRLEAARAASLAWWNERAAVAVQAHHVATELNRAGVVVES